MCLVTIIPNADLSSKYHSENTIVYTDTSLY